MKAGFRAVGFVCFVLLCSVSAAWAQDRGPGFTKVKEGIYTYAPDATTTTCSFVVTQEGVVMIDSCNSPLDSSKVLAAVKKVTDKPIRFLIDTEVHNDHTWNHYVFSPPATVLPKTRRADRRQCAWQRRSAGR